MEVDNSKINSNDLKILEKSLEIINEHLKKENLRGQGADKRANILITFIGIGASIALAFTKLVIDSGDSLKILIHFVFITILIYLVKAVFYILKVYEPRLLKRISPEIINDIQSFSFKDALAYEIKWKIWEYNQMIPENNYKLYYITRAQRNVSFAILSVLFLSIGLFVEKQILSSPCWFTILQMSIVTLLVLLAVFIDYIFEKFSFWEFKS